MIWSEITGLSLALAGLSDTPAGLGKERHLKAAPGPSKDLVPP